MKHDYFLPKQLADKLANMGFDWSECYDARGVNIKDGLIDGLNYSGTKWIIPIHSAVAWLWEEKGIFISVNMDTKTNTFYAEIPQYHDTLYGHKTPEDAYLAAIDLALQCIEKSGKIKAWIARDKTGDLFLYTEKPHKGCCTWIVNDDNLRKGITDVNLPNGANPQWSDDEPIEIDLIFKM